ncbi:MAG: oligosaccharide flippase family protein, partial [Candidatus Bipolaricaulia bacterium]
MTDVLGRTIFQILSASKGLILLPILARAYGAEGYGIWSQVCITAALVSPLVNLRLNEAVVRYLSGIEIHRQRGRAFFSCVLVTWGLSAGVLVAGALALRGISLGMFGDPNLERFVLLFLGLLLAGVSFSLATSYYRAVSRITTNTVLNVVEMMATLAATAIIAVWLRGRIETVLAVSIAITVTLSAVCLWDIARREGGFCFSSTWVKKFLRYSLPLVPAAALYWVVNSSDRFVKIGRAS